MQQLDFSSVIAAQDAALERGETVRIVRSVPSGRRAFIHNPQCQGQSETCRCDGRGRGGIRLPRATRAATLLPSHRDPVEVRVNNQPAVSTAGREYAGMSPARARARASLAAYVNANRLGT